MQQLRTNDRASAFNLSQIQKCPCTRTSSYFTADRPTVYFWAETIDRNISVYSSTFYSVWLTREVEFNLNTELSSWRLGFFSPQRLNSASLSVLGLELTTRVAPSFSSYCLGLYCYQGASVWHLFTLTVLCYILNTLCFNPHVCSDA